MVFQSRARAFWFLFFLLAFLHLSWADLTSHVESTVDALLLALDSDANGTPDFSEADLETWTETQFATESEAVLVTDFTENGSILVSTGPGTYTETAIGTVEGGGDPTSGANKVVHDYTAAQLVYGSSGLTALSPWAQQDFVFENFSSSDTNYGILNAAASATVLAVGVRCSGTCTTPAQISLEDGSGNAMTHTTPTAQTAEGDAVVFQLVTAGGDLALGEQLRFDCDNTPSPTTDRYTITVKYRYDRQ
jgi:hypothetical protein